MRIVGLSGGIASGKSTVTKLLRKEGVTVIDCDKIAQDVVRQGRWGYRRVVSAFGKGILRSNGEIDREALGKLVFGDSAARRKLNAATHLPVAVELVKQLLLAWLTLKSIVIVDMPLLFETGFYKWCKMSILVWCNEDQQVERIMTRDKLSRDDALARVASQMPSDKKKALAGIVIDNRTTRASLEGQVHTTLEQIRQGAWAWHLLTSPVLPAAVLYIGVMYKFLW